MYYKNYEDYMRSVLGYPVNNDMYTYENDDYFESDFTNTIDNIDEKQIEEMYPNIYTKINPFVCRECDEFKGKITKEEVDSIVEKIYSNVELDSITNIVNINPQNNSMDNRIIHNNVKDRIQNVNRNTNIEQSRIINSENRKVRQNNPLLRDLIKILVLNRLLRRPTPNRPPQHHKPPLFPPRPGNDYPMPPRRPIMPRDNYDGYIM